jgi:hypothetical protein
MIATGYDDQGKELVCCVCGKPATSGIVDLNEYRAYCGEHYPFETNGAAQIHEWGALAEMGLKQSLADICFKRGDGLTILMTDVRQIDLTKQRGKKMSRRKRYTPNQRSLIVAQYLADRVHEELKEMPLMVSEPKKVLERNEDESCEAYCDRLYNFFVSYLNGVKEPLVRVVDLNLDLQDLLSEMANWNAIEKRPEDDAPVQSL